MLADLFFQKFDLLPHEYKKQLDEGVSAPTIEDVDAMWELLQEESTLRDLINNVNKRFYPEFAKKKKEQERLEYQKKKEKTRRSARPLYNRVAYANPNYNERTNSDIRLIEAAKAHSLVTKKKAKLVNTTSPFVYKDVFVRYETPEEVQARMRAEEQRRLGWDPYAAPDKGVKPLKANSNKRLHNTF